MKIVNNENQTEDLTVEEAKTFESCKDMTDEQIKELLETIRIFTEIAYSAFAAKKAKEESGEDIQCNIAA